MKNRLVATLYLLLTMGLVGVSVSPQASARTTKRKTVRAKSTKRVVPPQPKPTTTTTTAVSTGNNDDATKAAIMAVYNRFVEIDIAASLNPEKGSDAYKEVLIGQALKQYEEVVKDYVTENPL